MDDDDSALEALSEIPGYGRSLSWVIKQLMKHSNQGKMAEGIIKSQYDHEIWIIDWLKKLELEMSSRPKFNEVYEIVLNTIVFSKLTTSDEKLNRFRNILKNTIHPVFEKETAKKIFLRMVSDLEDAHIRVLQVYGMVSTIFSGKDSIEVVPIEKKYETFLKGDPARILPYEEQDVTGWGTLRSSYISENTLLEVVAINKDDLRKLNRDLESQGCLLGREDFDSKRLAAFGARFILFITDAVAEVETLCEGR